MPNELKAIARRAMQERSLQPSFSPEALRESAAMTSAPTSQEPGIRDLRKLLWASIDNDSSRDLDQLSVGEALPGGDIKIYVAIADVDAAVKRGSAIDAHASANTTSVYTAAEIFPMLPEHLSTDLTSLNQGALRLALVVEMVVKADGAVTDSAVYRALVFNQAKLAYDSVAVWLDGKAAAPPRIDEVPGLAENLRLQDRAAQALRALRHRQGALDFESLAAGAVFHGDVLFDLVPDEGNRAKQLIEDFMVSANGVTAKFLEAKHSSSLRRTLRPPERWERIVALAASHGQKLPGAPDGAALAAFLVGQRKADAARFADLSLAVIKLLGRGEYTLEVPGEKPEGHFGLAVSDYTHSTAPNRRFPDLVTQRLVKAALVGAPAPYSNDELRAIAQHATDQAANADKVERQVRKSAAAQLLSSRIGQRFDGLITGASAKGTWVRVLHPLAEGRVVRGFEGLDVGDHVQVELVHTDVERGYVDFARSF